MSLWRGVFERRAPDALAAVERHIAPASMSKSVRELDDGLLDLIAEAHREAAGSSAGGR